MGDREGGKERSGGNRTGKAPASKRSGRLSRDQVNDLTVAVLAAGHYARAMATSVDRLQRMLELINDSMTVETVRKVNEPSLDISDDLWQAVLDDAPPHVADGADNRRGAHGEAPKEAPQRALSFYDR